MLSDNNKRELMKKLHGASHITGKFVLRSGKTSNEYFDKYLFEADPHLLDRICEFMLPLIPGETEVLAGLELGGVPLATVLSGKSGITCAFVRKEAKDYGTCKLAEGAAIDGKNVLVIEDVVTTGGQIIESVKELRKRGAKVDTVLCVILREDSAVDRLAAEGLKLMPAFTMGEIKQAVAD